MCDNIEDVLIPENGIIETSDGYLAAWLIDAVTLESSPSGLLLDDQTEE